MEEEGRDDDDDKHRHRQTDRQQKEKKKKTLETFFVGAFSTKMTVSLKHRFSLSLSFW